MRCFGRIAAVVLAVFASVSWEGVAHAADPIVVTLNKAYILRLGQSAGTVIVSNPTVLDVQLDSPRMAVMLGMSAGESQLLIFDSNQNEILSTVVIVTPELERQVSVTRHCGEGKGTCLEEEELSCGPRCVRIVSPGAAKNGSTLTPPDSGGGGGGGGGGAGDPTGGAADSAAGAAGAGAGLGSGLGL